MDPVCVPQAVRGSREFRGLAGRERRPIFADMRKLMLVVALALGGLACGVTGYSAGATVSTGVPRVTYVDDYPGWLWVDGQYVWTGSGWTWQEGYWVVDRPGYVYRPGYYRPHTRVWVTGRWQSAPRSHHSYYRASRDHRVYKYPPPHRARARTYRHY